MPDREIVIDPAFEGPPASAHGSYASGVLARYLAADAEITLRKPVPLGTGLRLVPHNRGLAAGSASYPRDGDRLGFASQTWITLTAARTPR